MKKHKIYFSEALLDKNERADWIELLKSRERFERKPNKIDENLQSKIEWVNDGEEADFWILPLDWNLYFKKGQLEKALQYCYNAEKIKKTVLSFAGGDYGTALFVPANTVVYKLGGYKSKLQKNERTYPFFLSDPLQAVLKIEEKDLFRRIPNSKSTLGFCGMAPHGLKIYMREWFVISLFNLKSISGLSNGEKQKIMSSSNLRFRVLQTFEKSGLFESNYIIRKKYRAGLRANEDRTKSTLEYYRNMIESDLILCARGAGNYSVRFYETLAMGRIPVFIDTDSPLPDIGEKNWNDYIIWVDSKEVQKAPEIAKSWLANRDLNKQKRLNRQFWVEHFRGDNFWIKELEKLTRDKTKND